MPGVGVRTAARILLEVGDGSSFPTAGHLAAYAGLAPVTRRSGIVDPRRAPRPRRQQTAQARVVPCPRSRLCADPESSRAYYDRKRAEGKKHNAALICLARRRCDVLYAMLRDGTYYQAKTPAAA